MSDLKISELPVINSASDDDYLVINDGNITSSTLTWSNLKSSIDALDGAINFVSAGTESLPTIHFNDDTNTGIYSPGIDQLAFVTNGDTAVYIDALGKMGLGNENPSSYDAAANGIVIGSDIGSDFGVTISTGSTSQASIYFADARWQHERGLFWLDASGRCRSAMRSRDGARASSCSLSAYRLVHLRQFYHSWDRDRSPFRVFCRP